MKRLSSKESMAISTIHDALREFRCKGINANVDMQSYTISIFAYPDTVKEARKIKKLLCFFKDEDDDIIVKHYLASYDCAEFYKVALTKKMV